MRYGTTITLESRGNTCRWDYAHHRHQIERRLVQEGIRRGGSIIDRVCGKTGIHSQLLIDQLDQVGLDLGQV